MKIKEILAEAIGGGFVDQMKRAITQAPKPSGLRVVDYQPTSQDSDGKVKKQTQVPQQTQTIQPQEPKSVPKTTAEPKAPQTTAPVQKKTASVPTPTAPKDNPNASIKSKVDYLVKQGVLQSGRITDDEKQYIDSVDVYVDTNKFDNVDPSQKFIKSTPPHYSLTISSVQIPLSDWERALGRSGEGLSGYVGFDLTPAGWWSDDFKAYVNPNSNLSDLVDRYQKG